ncbi:MAG: tetraacyldisaccharide 4'-kinase [Geobacteraceae bacterium]|nr:tetraacyldisaccharide 4'-kinase [Geobacteraceae bacterium]
MISLERFIRDVWEGKRPGPLAGFLVVFLAPFSLVYSLVMNVREFLYRNGVLASRVLPRPVISVGNISVGGTGKTPMTIFLARLIMAKGKRVAVLSRGYGGRGGKDVCVVADGRDILLPSTEAGDEPFLMAVSVPGLIVVTCSDRYRAGVAACERFRPDILLLDDGFQHLRLHRDLDILLLDCRKPFGNGFALPAGLLRENRSAVRRADMVVYTRCGGALPAVSLSGLPSCRSDHSLRGVVAFGGGPLLPFSDLKGIRGVAFAGVGDPVSFFAALEAEGLELAAAVPLPDHCRYEGSEIETLLALLRETGGDYLITTEKDAVKIRELFPDTEVYAAVLEIVLEETAFLEREVEKLL